MFENREFQRLASPPRCM